MSVLDDLEKIQRLKEQGILTEEEFENEKNKILNKSIKTEKNKVETEKNIEKIDTNINTEEQKKQSFNKKVKEHKNKVCSNCGNEIQEGENFCGKCGHKVDEENSKTKKIKLKKQYIIIGIVAICIVVCIGIIIYNNKSNIDISDMETVSNTINNESENSKKIINSSTEYADTATGMCFKFDREELKEMFCSHYTYEMNMWETYGYIDESFNYLGTDTENNTRLYGLTMYYDYLYNPYNYDVKPYFVLTTVENVNSEIMRVMGVIVDYNKLEENQKEKSLTHCQDMITSIDSSIPDEEAISIVKELFSKESNNQEPFIYKNGLLYGIENYDQNGYNYIRISVTAITEEKAKELYNIDINSL